MNATYISPSTSEYRARPSSSLRSIMATFCPALFTADDVA